MTEVAKLHFVDRNLKLKFLEVLSGSPYVDSVPHVVHKTWWKSSNVM